MKKRLLVYFFIFIGLVGFLFYRIFHSTIPAPGEAFKMTLLMQKACREGDMEKARELPDKWEGDINARDKQGITPLHMAASENWPAVAGILIEKGANIEGPDKNGLTPLLYAIHCGSSPVVSLLLEKGADTNVRTTEGWSLLMYALHHGKPADARKLVEKGANINAKTKKGWTPLMFALKYNRPGMAKLLIAKGADIHAKNKKGWTPLMFALENKLPELAELLMEKGADINAKNNADWTPLMLALENKLPELAGLLIAKGAEINAKNYDDWTPLMVALRYGESAGAELLIRKGADINAKDKKDRTPLIFAIKYRQPEIVKLLINKGANIHARSSFRWSVMHYAARYGNGQLVRLLAKNGAKINSTDWSDRTPLLLACRYGILETAGALLEAGANIQAKSSSGWTPLMYALAGEHTGIVQLLKNKDIHFEKVAKEMKENAALYFLNALLEAEPARGKKEKEIIKKSLGKKWEKNKTIEKFLEKNQYSYSIFQKSLHLKGCDFSFASLEKNQWLEINIPPRLRDMSQVILLKGKYMESQGKPGNAAEIYTHFLACLRQLSVLESLDVKEAVLKTVIRLAPAFNGYFESTGKKKTLCEAIYQQVAGYENELFSLEALVDDQKQVFLFNMKRVNRELEKGAPKTPAPDPDKDPEEALKYYTQALLSTYFSQLLKDEAPKIADRYFGYYEKAAASNRPEDWQYADDELKKLKAGLPKDPSGKLARPDVDLVIKSTKENRHKRSKEFVVHAVKIVLVRQLSGPFKEKVAEYHKNLEQLKQLKNRSLRACGACTLL